MFSFFKKVTDHCVSYTSFSSFSQALPFLLEQYLLCHLLKSNQENIQSCVNLTASQDCALLGYDTA